MSRRPPSIYRRARWRLEWAFYLGLEKLVGLLTPGIAARLGGFLGWLAGRMSPLRRKVVERNLRIAFGRDKSADELKRLVDEVFLRCGANLISSLCTAGMSPDQLASVVSIENPELLDELRASERGVVALLAHMGNWEVLAHAFTQLVPPGRRAGTIYRLLNNPHMDEHVKAVRRRAGLELFEKRSNPLAMASFIRGGGSLGILSDQRAEAAGEIVPFFGRMTSCTPLPAILSRRLGVPVIGISMRTVGYGKWRMKLHRLNAESTTQNCMLLLEEMIRESPADVFWLQDRWRTNRKAPLHLMGRAPTADARAACTQFRRALVWLGDIDQPKKPETNGDDLIWECSVPGSRTMPLPAWLPTDVRRHRRGSSVLTRDELMAELRRIDNTGIAPMDVIVAATDKRVVAKACRRLGLALVEAVEHFE
jgi:Kdo2-lipid IVA lauroyltransferase/acyltransferase